MTALDYSVFECGYVTHEVIDPVALDGVRTKFWPFPSAIFPVREMVVLGKYQDLLRDWWTLQWSGLRVRVGNVFPRWGR